jgi:hypothetical protein
VSIESLWQRVPIAKFMRLRRLLSILSITMVVAGQDSTAANISSGVTYYVSDAGDDNADGTSFETAYRSIDHALAKARTAKARVTIYLVGRFVRSTPVRLYPADHGLTIAAAPGMKARIEAGPNAKVGILVDGADSVRLHGLSLEGFATDGIFIKNAKDVIIEDNTVLNTLSSGWSQGSIHLTGIIPGATIQRNTIIGANYAGILIDTNITSNVSKLTIKYNSIYSSCRTVSDCGAIYVNDRGKRSFGGVIADNIIEAFGSKGVSSRGIYLDDWASDMLVRGNRITGPGTFAIQIHGGSRNNIRDNIVNLDAIDEVLLVQPAANGKWENMTDNVFVDNIFFIGSGHSRPLLMRLTVPSVAMPYIIGNKMCLKSECFAAN